MKEMEKKLRMELLEKLMEEMDEVSVGKLKPQEDPTVEVMEVEKEEMPLSDAKEMIKEKLEGHSEDEEEDSEEDSDESMYEEEESDYEEDDEDEEYTGSDLSQRLKELRRKRK